MGVEQPHGRRLLDVPNTNRMIQTGGQQVDHIFREAHLDNLLRMTTEMLQRSAFVGTPQIHLSLKFPLNIRNLLVYLPRLMRRNILWDISRYPKSARDGLRTPLSSFHFLRSIAGFGNRHSRSKSRNYHSKDSKRLSKMCVLLE